MRSPTDRALSALDKQPDTVGLDNVAEARGCQRRAQAPHAPPGSSQLAEPADSSKTEGATVSAGLSHTQTSAHPQEPN